MLPENRGSVGKGSGETLMTTLEGSMAKLHAIVKDLPESFYISICRETNVYQIDGNNTLIETAVIQPIQV